MQSPYQSYQNVQTEEPRSFDLLAFIKSITGVEALVILCIVVAVVGVVLLAGFSQDAKNKDMQKQFDMEQTIIPALQDFYKNSGAEESDRFYPISRCSSDLNEVDYEFTLRNALTGINKELDTHQYISQLPLDRQGVYSRQFTQRKIPYRCPEKLNFNTTQSGGMIYQDGFDSCNFSSQQNIRSCYLYTTSTTGSEYKLAYFSHSSRCFVVYLQNRSQRVVKQNQC